MGQVQKIEQEVPVAPDNAVTPMQLLQIATQQGADVAQLEKLMTLQERWEANEARKAFVEALNGFKADPPKIIKNKHVAYSSRGGGTEYDHATLDQVSDVIGKALAAHGLSHTWKVDQSSQDKEIKVYCVLTHRLGHSEEVTLSAMPDDSGGKNLIQQIGSTVTYLQRYTLLAATGLAAADQDDDGATAASPPIDDGQKARIISLIKETGSDTAAFCKFMGVGSVDDIRQAGFDHAVQALEKKREKPND